MMNTEFKDICYFNDQSFNKVFPEFLKVEEFQRLINYTFNKFQDKNYDEFISSIKGVDDFQLKFIIYLIKKLESETVNNFTTSGLSAVSLTKRHLYISNHRNIIMDPSFINLALFDNQGDNFKSTAIAIGNNLLSNPFVKNMARANKCFIVERDANIQKMLESSKRLSKYINHLITDEINSVWIAQREGRTKDGDDRAQAGLIKMLQMHGEGSFSEKMSALNIVPVVISYEYDPYAEDKMVAVAKAIKGEKYVKTTKDDQESMYNESIGYKGNVHIHFGEKFSNKFFEKLDKDIPINKKIRQFTAALDNFTHKNYKLWPSNYIAADVMNNNEQFREFYSYKDKKMLLDRLNYSMKRLKTKDDVYKRAFLMLYANPVKNFYSNSDKYNFNY